MPHCGADGGAFLAGVSALRWRFSGVLQHGRGLYRGTCRPASAKAFWRVYPHFSMNTIAGPVFGF
jgi:hypothetical protein